MIAGFVLLFPFEAVRRFAALDVPAATLLIGIRRERLCSSRRRVAGWASECEQDGRASRQGWLGG